MYWSPPSTNDSGVYMCDWQPKVNLVIGARNGHIQALEIFGKGSVS